MRIIIAGSRSIKSLDIVEEACKASNTLTKATEIVSGAANGVDKLGEQWAKLHNIPVKQFKPAWDDIDFNFAKVVTRADGTQYNKLAGIQRNEEMGRYADALLAVWDEVSTGTKHMIEFMRYLGKPVFIYRVPKQ